MGGRSRGGGEGEGEWREVVVVWGGRRWKGVLGWGRQGREGEAGGGAGRVH